MSNEKSTDYVSGYPFTKNTRIDFTRKEKEPDNTVRAFYSINIIEEKESRKTGKERL